MLSQLALLTHNEAPLIKAALRFAESFRSPKNWLAKKFPIYLESSISCTVPTKRASFEVRTKKTRERNNRADPFLPSSSYDAHGERAQGGGES